MSKVHSWLRSAALSLCLVAIPQVALAVPQLTFETIACDGDGFSGAVLMTTGPHQQMRWMWIGNNFYLAAVGANGEIDNSHGQALMIFDFLTMPRVTIAGMPDAQGPMKQALIDISHNIIKACWKRIGKSINEFQKSLR